MYNIYTLRRHEIYSYLLIKRVGGIAFILNLQNKSMIKVPFSTVITLKKSKNKLLAILYGGVMLE